MAKLSTLLTLSLATGYVLSAPHPLHRRDDLPPEYKWPNYCSNQNYRDATQLGHADNAMVNAVRLYAGDNYKPTNNQGESVSLPVWLSRVTPVTYSWSCNGAGCEIGNWEAACPSGGASGPVGIALEQIKGLYAYLKSVQKSVTYEKDFIVDHMGVLFEGFGGSFKEVEAWDKKIGTVAAGAGALAAMVPSLAGMSAGIGFAGAVAGFLLPEEEKEQQFKWTAEQSASFSDNVDLIVKAVDTWIDLNIMKQIDDIKYYIDMPGNLFSVIEEGRFAADPAPPLLGQSNDNIRAALSVPLINKIWRDHGVAVIVFEGPAWRDAGYDLCGDYNLKFYEDLQPDRRICDGDGNLHMIMRFADVGTDGSQKSFRDIARDVPGIMDMTKFGTNRDQTIEGSVENQKKGGYDYGISAEEAVERLKTMENADQIAWGKVNVWNLPVCSTKPRPSADPREDSDLEEFMATSFLFNCGGYKDQNGKDWPYGNPWCGHPDSSC
ncbi:hypothetical protein BCR34DRAFT_630517 [Clohesyomyces aquaticus]|uniref:Uncharacterized protein n=1 Tax=Clohesyomyces aquaticus TaxID=1231657 RepID=A0A1Y1ZE09_9PLEO|nr:hypothetical protein BCR34DRAFT_630517 [Clohesyomyces aquaticus]